jgi:uncharacterized protein YndB with AHSA1/START domain
MSTHATGTSIQHSIVVEAPQARAFTVFTEQFDRIKPHEHNLLGDEAIDETVFEARPGGRIYDRGVNGGVCVWARVLTVEPPERVVFTWDISASWATETDHEKTSEVEVRFIPEGDARTRVELEHRHLERHGEGWEGMRAGVDGADGWPLYLGRFGALLA